MSFAFFPLAAAFICEEVTKDSKGWQPGAVGTDAPVHKPAPAPIDEKGWQPGDLPHAENIDLVEYPNEVLKMTVCRSFRADLLHKLEIIVRANGGAGEQGVWRAASELGISRSTLGRWRTLRTYPGSRVMFETIDRVYSDSIQLLAQRKLRRKRRRRADRFAAS